MDAKQICTLKTTFKIIQKVNTRIWAKKLHLDEIETSINNNFTNQRNFNGVDLHT